jgi:PilZ domain
MAAIRKREARKSLRRPGWITLDGGFAVRPCVVQDISSAGAKITADAASRLPGTLRLAFARDTRTGRNCQVVWRSGNSIGVRFIR